jgi:hypothetical protein
VYDDISGRRFAAWRYGHRGRHGAGAVTDGVVFTVMFTVAAIVMAVLVVRVWREARRHR